MCFRGNAFQRPPRHDPVTAGARRLYGRGNPRAVDAVARAVADLPYAVVRRHAYDEPMPSWLEADVAAAARAMLKSFGERA